MKHNFSKAIVTGGAGFIGSHIVERLVKDGIETYSIDNYFAGKKENLSHLHDYNNFHEIKCDVTDFKGLEKYFKFAEVVFHNAASKKTVCLNDPREDLQINAEGTFNILELSRKYDFEKVVIASTGSVYGEPQYFPQDESHPLNPTSYYGVSKLAGERYGKVFEHLYGLNVSIIRYFHVYGPRQESSDVGGVVTIFARRLFYDKPLIIFGDGTQQRSFTYVDDVVRANLLIANNRDTKGEVYNCASGIKVTINELAQIMKEKFGKQHIPVKYEDWQPGDIKIFDIDNTKLKSLGFKFLTDFESGIEKTILWAKNYFEGRTNE